jgi:hypothetical protein
VSVNADPIEAHRSEGPVDWFVRLDRSGLLPGRLVPGLVRVTARSRVEARRVVATLVGTETWRYDRTDTDSQGHTRTETVTRTEVLPRIPIELSGPLVLGPGETREWRLELPVPGLGPASFDGTEVGCAWELEVKLDVAGRRDAANEAAV